MLGVTSVRGERDVCTVCLQFSVVRGVRSARPCFASAPQCTGNERTRIHVYWPPRCSGDIRCKDVFFISFAVDVFGTACRPFHMPPALQIVNKHPSLLLAPRAVGCLTRRCCLRLVDKNVPQYAQASCSADAKI